MRQRNKQPLQSAEKTVRDIRRATRKRYSAEEKIRIDLAAQAVEDDADLLLGRELPSGGTPDVSDESLGRCLWRAEFCLMLHSSGGHDEPEILRFSSR